MSDERARQIGVRGDAPSHAGIGQTFAGQRRTRPDSRASTSPWPERRSTTAPPTARARFGPRAIRTADDGGHAGRPHLASGLDPFAVLEVVDHGAVVADAIEHVRTRADRVYLTIDVDVLDPAFAPGTGTPEPGGLTTRELRHVAAELDLCAADVVEVCPPCDGSSITALAGERIALDVLTGTVARRSGVPLGQDGAPRPQDP